MRLAVSPIPMGRTPGHLSRAMSLQATKSARPHESRKVVHRYLAHSAKYWHRLLDATLKVVYSRHHAQASRPDGLASPLTFSDRCPPYILTSPVTPATHHHLH